MATARDAKRDQHKDPLQALQRLGQALTKLDDYAPRGIPEW